MLKEAIDGIRYAIDNDIKIKLHATAGLAVLVFFSRLLNAIELSIILIVISLVIASEVINTAIEALCDIVNPENDIGIKAIKDMSAGFVLISAILSVTVFFVIIFPKFF